jgi:hypothetical protein
LDRWRELSQRVLGLSPVERLAELDALVASRAELERSLRASPPAGGIDRDQALELERTEAELTRVLGELQADMSQRIDALRRAREATSGYRPTALSHAAFVSRSV